MSFESSSDDSLSEDCYEPNILEEHGSKDFVTEINSIIINAENYDCNVTENALKLNQEMQKKIEEIKFMLQKMLRKCQEKYKHNEEFLKSQSSKKVIKDTVIHKRYNFCGIPFFKTKQNFTPAPNDDYIARKKKNELFGADIILQKQRYWSADDKTHIVQGVNKQVNQHLILKFRNEPSTSGNFSDSNCIDLKKKLSQCDKNFKICWYRVASEFVHNRFNEKVCEAMWNMYLRPDIYRQKWTEVENIKLIRAAMDNNFQNWSRISEIMKNRSELQCFVQYYSSLVCQPENINKWSPEDDKKLLKVVNKCRMNNIIRWSLVKQYFPNLSKKQLHHRYQYSIDPNINKSKFTWQEDCAILAAIEQYGENFSCFPLGLFPGRTIVQIRNRWHNTLKFSGKHSQWTIEEDKRLVELVKEYGEGNYSILLNKFNNKTRSSIRQRHITIKKFFEKNPNASLEQCPRKHRPLKTDITVENWQQKVVENLESVKSTEETVDEKLKRSQKYYNSLRSLEKEYYQFFKFSYDFSFIQDTVPVYCMSNLNFLTNLLDVKIDKITLTNVKSRFNKADYLALQNLAAFRNKKQNSKPLMAIPSLPPSWPTLLGFRGVCIQCASTIHTREEIKYESPVRDTPEGDIAKDLFRKRFHLLFYKTALLSRLECFIPNETVLTYKNTLQNLKATLDLAQNTTISKKRKLPSPEIEEIIPIKNIKKEEK